MARSAATRAIPRSATPRAARAGEASPPTRGRRRLAAVVGAAGREVLALDRIVHDRTRLGMLSALAVNERLSFVELKDLLDTSDGNLSVHARKLEDAGYVTCTKSFSGRVPRTEFRLAAAGRKALDGYLRHMELLIHATRALKEHS